MRKLYKQFPAYKKEYLQVSDSHKIYVEQSGNPKGKPVISFHGGPGSKTKPHYRTFFNPEKWRIVMFDQRGCGKSKPSGEVKDNTTWDLLNDVEKIRKHLGIKKWMVFGGSWGSTLSLAYAEKYPDHISKLILRGIWLCRKEDIDWLLKGKELRRMFPDLWAWRVENLKKLKIRDSFLVKDLHDKLFKGTEKEKKLATAIFTNWEDQIMDVDHVPELIKPKDVEKKDIESCQILTHYVINNCFFGKNELLKNAHKIPKVPTVIIHGRYDVVCPLDNAWQLHKKLPGSILEIIPGSGHHSTEPGVTDKLIEYTDKFASK